MACVRVDWRTLFLLGLAGAMLSLSWGTQHAQAAIGADESTPLTFTPSPSAFSETETLSPTPSETDQEQVSSPSPQDMASLLVGLAPGNTLRDLKSQIDMPVYDAGLGRLNVYRIEVPVEDLQDKIRELTSLDGVSYVEPDYTVTGQDVIPNDPGFPFQYALVNIRAPQGWEITTGSHLVTIAIVDTGVDQTHPELAPKILAGYDFVNGDTDPQDDNGHGTHVAGIAAAMSNNGVGVAGVSWNARILPVKVLNASNTGTYSNVAAGIIWATDQGAQIINLSLGGISPSLTLENAVNYAASQGVLLVAAAGNTGGALLYPARYAAVIAVANTNAANLRVPSSAFGPELDLSAPGASIYSLSLGGGYTTLSGTSMSAPHVSGALALLLSMPGIGPGQARVYLENSALDLDAPGWDVFTGYGLIQLDAALLLAIPTSTPTQYSSPTGNAPHPNPSSPFPVVATATFTVGATTSSNPSNALIASLTPSPSLIASWGVSPTSTLTPTFTITPSASDTFFRTGRFAWLCLGILLLIVGVMLLLWGRRMGYR
ncbi:MAG: hypothetical protein DDG60_15685 [Anaerolineae bacterium]|nr:MAG: hypothetical protein DDG60_15685 [Anaerolineae bacterium]